MSFKQLGAFGTAAGIAMTLGSSAWAATTSVSINFSTPLNTLPSASVQLPEPNFARTVVAGDSFLDTYFFSLTETSDVFGGVSSPLAFFKGLTVKGLAFDSITLAAVGGASSASSSPLPSFTFEGLTAGNYQLTIAGHAIGQAIARVPRPAGAGGMPDFLGHAVHGDSQADSAVTDQRDAQFLFPHGSLHCTAGASWPVRTAGLWTLWRGNLRGIV